MYCFSFESTQTKLLTSIDVNSFNLPKNIINSISNSINALNQGKITKLMCTLQLKSLNKIINYLPNTELEEFLLTNFDIDLHEDPSVLEANDEASSSIPSNSQSASVVSDMETDYETLEDY